MVKMRIGRKGVNPNPTRGQQTAHVWIWVRAQKKNKMQRNEMQRNTEVRVPQDGQTQKSNKFMSTNSCWAPNTPRLIFSHLALNARWKSQLLLESELSTVDEHVYQSIFSRLYVFLHFRIVRWQICECAQIELVYFATRARKSNFVIWSFWCSGYWCCGPTASSRLMCFGGKQLYEITCKFQKVVCKWWHYSAIFHRGYWSSTGARRDIICFSPCMSMSAISVMSFTHWTR